jgi:hypothetical protein
MPPNSPTATRPDWCERFLRFLASTGNVTASARLTPIDRSTVTKLRQRNAQFRRDYKRAKRDAVDAMEHEARKRAVKGTLVPIYQNGRRVGYKVERSDALLMFMLKAERPEKFKDRSTVEHALAGPVVDAQRQRAILADPEAARLACELDARLAQRALPAPADEKPPGSQDPGGETAV